MKKVKFLGQTFDVVEDRDLEEARATGEIHHYVVARVVDTMTDFGSPELRSRRLRTLCEDCAELCWIDPKSLEALKGIPTKIVCLQCMAEVVRQDRKGADG